MSSAAWERVHARYEVVRRLLERAKAQRTPEVLSQFDREIDAAFGSRAALLLHLEGQWYRNLEALLDEVLDDRGRGPLQPATIAREIDLRQPMLKEILNAYADDPALQDTKRRRPHLHGLSSRVAAA